LAWPGVSNFLIAEVEPRPHGNDNFTAAPGAFRAQDGLINIAANKQEQFEALVHVLGREDLARDPRFALR
jgi:crotonobetainyl-CoA:carnitine CoA-transferase CaiB-like acyl-CoA transferase